MTDFDNTNTGALFRNERRTNERQPEYTGRINADGVDYWLAAWVKKSKAGKTYFSFALTAVDEEQRGDSRSSGRDANCDNDEAPF